MLRLRVASCHLAGMALQYMLCTGFIGLGMAQPDLILSYGNYEA